MRPQDKLSDDEFFFSYGKIPIMSYTSTVQNDLLIALAKQDPLKNFGLWINPRRARKLGIGEGDRVELENTVSGQKAVAYAHLTELVRKGPCGKAIKEGTVLNKIIPYRLEPVVGSFRTCEFTIKVRKVS